MTTTEKIRKGYVEFVLEHQKNPTVFNLCKLTKIKEEDFYEQYNAITAIESDLWKSFFEETKEKIEKEEIYPSYTVREKLLAFYYTWIEVLKQNRSYILYSYEEKMQVMMRNPKLLEPFKDIFLAYAQELVAEGRETGEIAERLFLADRYAKILWWQALTILDFWIKDQSKAFEQTDVFIEKSVNFAFDLIGRNAIDSSFDYLKFVFQNR